MPSNRFKILEVGIVIGALLSESEALVGAPNWSQSDAPAVFEWYGLGSSADGDTVFAATGVGRLYMSTNGGFDWRLMPSPVLSDLNWGLSSGVSADGTHLVLATAGGDVLVSNDSGTNWQQITTITGTSVACSADGSKMLAAAPLRLPPSIGNIFLSTNYGSSWIPTSAPRANWFRVICSADGTQIVAAGDSGVYTSGDFGQSWTSNSVPSSGIIAASADGNRLILASGGQIYISTNSGTTWSLSFNSPSESFWESVASSADGIRLAAVAYQAPIYTSGDGGTTWTSNAVPAFEWFGVTSSADGSRLVANAGGGGIWASQATPAPELAISRSGNVLLISWIIPSATFVLQESQDLSTPTWSVVVTQPRLNYANLKYEVRLPISSSATLFRLIEQH